MFCYNCGEKLDDTAIYCEYCGVKVKKEDATKGYNENEAIASYYELEYELEDINDQVATLPAKNAQLERTRNSRSQKYRQLHAVRQAMLEEKKDYDKLLKFSFASLKGRLSGDLDERKRKEESEYLNALANFEHFQEDYSNLDKIVKDAENEINRLTKLKRRVPELENQIESLLTEITAGKTTEKLTKLERSYTQEKKELAQAEDIENRFKQADNLISRAYNLLTAAVDSLGSAEGYGTWDTYFGGGFIADSLKHDKLEQARNDINQAQSLIKRAKDIVDVIDDIYINFEAPDIFFDMFFDNFFFDLFGNAKISQTKEQVENAIDELANSRNKVTNNLQQWGQIKRDLIIKVNGIRKEIKQEKLTLM